MSLKEYTTQQLSNELERRAKEHPIPNAYTDCDFRTVYAIAVRHIQAIANDNRTKYDEHYIFEATMEAVYGENIWDWYNENYRDS